MRRCLYGMRRIFSESSCVSLLIKSRKWVFWFMKKSASGYICSFGLEFNISLWWVNELLKFPLHGIWLVWIMDYTAYQIPHCSHKIQHYILLYEVCWTQNSTFHMLIYLEIMQLLEFSECNSQSCSPHCSRSGHSWAEISSSLTVRWQC